MSSLLKQEMPWRSACNRSETGGRELANQDDQLGVESKEVFRTVLKIRNLIREAESESKKLKVRGVLWSEGLGEGAANFRESISQINAQLCEQENSIQEFYGKLLKFNGSACTQSNVDSPEIFTARPKTEFNGTENFNFEKLVEGSEKTLLKNFLFCLVERNKKMITDSSPDEESKGLIYENLKNLTPQGQAKSCDACSAYLLKIHHLEGDKRKQHDTLVALRRERKQLKSDNMQLLEQLKGVHNTLDLKENELRDFIMNFGIRMKESEMAIKALRCENEKMRRELAVAKLEESEGLPSSNSHLNSVALKSCSKSDQALSVRGDASGVLGGNKQATTLGGNKQATACSISFEHVGHEAGNSAIAESEFTGETGINGVQTGFSKKASRLLHRSDMVEDNDELEARNLLKTRLSLEVPPSHDHLKLKTSHSSGSSSSAGDSQSLSVAKSDFRIKSRSSTPTTPTLVKQDKPRLDCEEEDHIFVRSNSDPHSPPGFVRIGSSRTRRKALSKTFSKFFGKDKQSTDVPIITSLEEGFPFNTDDAKFGSKWQRWEVIKTTPFSSWSAQDVMIWLELECCVSWVQLAKCQENIKCGSVVLNQDDTDLANALGLTHPLHKLKLRLALDERRDPKKYSSHLQQLDHVWVARTWLRDLGLAQYSSIFEEGMVDGRMVNEFTKRDLEKYLHMSKKQHQVSFFCGVDLLRALDFDKETLYMRRSNCEDINMDILVWTNQRVVNWMKSIDMKEYADNLAGSGIHGAFITLESSFHADSMAQALNLPPGNSALHSQLKIKVDALITVARRSVSPTLLSKAKNTTSFMRAFSFRSSRETQSNNNNSSASFKLHRKAPLRHSTNSLPARTQRLRNNRPFSDVMVSVRDGDEVLT